jgi:hypothetical protein
VAIGLHYRNWVILSIQHHTILKRNTILIGQNRVHVPDNWMIDDSVNKSGETIYPLGDSSNGNDGISLTSEVGFSIISHNNVIGSVHIYKLSNDQAREIASFISTGAFKAKSNYRELKWNDSSILVHKNNGYWVFYPDANLILYLDDLKELSHLEIIRVPNSIS